MSRNYDAPWVVLGMQEKNKLLISHPDTKYAGRYETLICERKPGTEEPEFVYMRLMWCNREAVQTCRDHLDDLLKMWEADDCEIRRWYVRRLDAHFFGEDCPYTCEKYERWKAEQKGEPDDERQMESNT